MGKPVIPAYRQTVVAMIDGKFSVKRLTEYAGKVFMEAADSDVLPIQRGKNQELVIWRAVTYVIHKAL